MNSKILYYSIIVCPNFVWGARRYQAVLLFSMTNTKGQLRPAQFSALGPGKWSMYSIPIYSSPKNQAKTWLTDVGLRNKLIKQKPLRHSIQSLFSVSVCCAMNVSPRTHLKTLTVAVCTVAVALSVL